jgi:hypothetical protein
MEEKLITTREASGILGISEQEVIDLANAGQLVSIKVGGEYLRYRRKDVLNTKEELKRKASASAEGVFHTRAVDWREFIYFYDFYIICGVIIAILFWFIFFNRHA